MQAVAVEPLQVAQVPWQLAQLPGPFWKAPDGQLATQLALKRRAGALQLRHWVLEAPLQVLQPESHAGQVEPLRKKPGSHEVQVEAELVQFEHGAEQVAQLVPLKKPPVPQFGTQAEPFQVRPRTQRLQVEAEVHARQFVPHGRQPPPSG